MALRPWALLAAAAAVSGGSACWTNGKLWAVNGLDVPVRVSVAGQSQEIPPGGRVSFAVRSGTHTVDAVTVEGKGREALQIEVPGWGGAAVYSVAGAAPLYTVRVFYSAKGSAPDPQQQLLCGQRTFSEKVDHYFEEPPESVSLSSSQQIASRTTLQMGKGGWHTCAAALEDQGRLADVVRMAGAIRELAPSDEMVAMEAKARFVSGDQAGSVRLLKDAAWSGGSRDLHRMYQMFGRDLGQREALEAEYRKRLERDPGNADLQYLEARLHPLAARIAALQSVLSGHPDDVDARLVLSWSLNAAGRFAPALAVMEPLGDGQKLSSDNHARLMLWRTWSLAALGKLGNAVAVLKEGVKPEDGNSLGFLVRQGQLAAWLGRRDLEPTQETLQAAAANEYGRQWRKLLYQSQVHPEELDLESAQGKALTVGPVLRAVVDDPVRARLLVHKLSLYEAEMLPEETSLLLLGEAWRAGDAAADRLLRQVLFAQGVDFDALRAFVLEGRPTPELEELGEDRAPMHVARARVLRAEGNAAAAAAEERLARRYDVFGVSTRALESWPPARAGEEAVQLASAKEGGKKAGGLGPRGAQRPQPKTVEHRLTRVEGLTLQPAP